MNNTRESTPPNPNLDLLNRSTELNKTLGILGTPHEESIAKLNPTITRLKRRNRRNPAKNTSNPRTRKTTKIEPLYSRIWEGNHSPKNHEGFPQISPIKSRRERSRKQPKEITKRGLRKLPPTNNREQHIQTLRNHAESYIHATKVHTRSSLPPDHPTLSTRSHHEALKLVLWKS
jgi:hypothetical protein